ncbi:MAG: stage IV sporulation protein A, partial [Clostridia bacterium]|nr:stage IV sporulation protein A [Clostridia bacterium]
LIDCVGYMVKDALGDKEGDRARMVTTPWSDVEMPFEEAAELGTSKVISDHSNVGILVTSDGSVTDINRSAYVDAEERVVASLKASGKPFVILLNSRHPEDKDTIKLVDALASRYDAPVLAKDVLNMTVEDINQVLGEVLYEFPIKRIDLNLPDWTKALSADHDLIAFCRGKLIEYCEGPLTMRDAAKLADSLVGEGITKCWSSCDLGTGIVSMDFEVQPDLFYKTLSECAGHDIGGELGLLCYVSSLSRKASKVARLNRALEQVEETGYGVVEPTEEEMILDEPEIMKQSGRFGVRLKASAPSLHIMSVDVKTEVNPVVGSEAQSEELVKYLLSEFESNPKGIWQTNMFGKSLSSLVREGISNKLQAIPEEAGNKMRKTMGKIVNEGKGGMICILL